MRTTSSISFYCRPSKVNRKGLSPIEATIIINSRRVSFNLPRKEEPEAFIKYQSRKNSDLCRYLSEVRKRLDEAQTELIEKGVPVSSSTLRDYVRNGGIRLYTIRDMFEDYQHYLEGRIGIDLCEKSYQKFLLVMKDFMERFGGDNEASSVTSGDMSLYYAHLRREYSISTSASKMMRVKAVFRYAFNDSKIKVFPFNSIKITKGKPNIEYLTHPELERIRTHNFEDTPRIGRIRDLFIFQASSGLSYGDLKELEPGDIRETEGIHYIRKERLKTGNVYTAIVFPEGVEIFNRYKGRLPVPSNQKMNAYLKEIQDICGIEKNITSHLARKSYATRLLNEGMSMETVAKCIGDTVDVCRRHYAKTLDETIIREAKKIIH